jgi:drug/metabolite transporter (DMT)-like permease
MTQNRILPYTALAVGIIALSLSAMFVRWADAPGTITGFYRLLISTLLFTPFFIKQQKQREKIDRKFLLFPILGGLFTAFDFAFWNTSVQFTTAANATLLGNTSPLWVAFAALFIFREKLRGSFWIGLALALTGAVFVVGSDFLKHPTLGIGDLMASAAAVFYASYQLVTQRGRMHIDPSVIYGLSAQAQPSACSSSTLHLEMPSSAIQRKPGWYSLPPRSSRK